MGGHATTSIFAVLRYSTPSSCSYYSLIAFRHVHFLSLNSDYLSIGNYIIILYPQNGKRVVSRSDYQYSCWPSVPTTAPSINVSFRPQPKLEDSSPLLTLHKLWKGDPSLIQARVDLSLLQSTYDLPFLSPVRLSIVSPSSSSEYPLHRTKSS